MPGPLRWAAAYLAFALAAHTYILFRPAPCDNCVYTRYARDWAAGARLYSDRYEPKTPVVFWLFRGLGAADPRLTTYFAAAGLLAAAATVVRLALTPLAPTAAAVAPVALIAGVSAVGVHHLYDSFALPASVLAIAAFGVGVGLNSITFWPAVAGAAFAVTAGLFPPAGLVAVALVPFAVWDVRAHGLRPFLCRATVFVAAATALAGAVIAHMVYSGYWGGFWDAMRANRRYAAMDAEPVAVHLTRWGAQVYRLAALLGPAAVAAALGGLVVPALRWRSLSAGLRAWAVVAGLWLAAAQAGTFPGGRHYANYYALLVGPLAVLAGLAFAAVPDSPLTRRLLLGYATAVVLLSLLANGRDGLRYRRNDLAARRTQIRDVTYYLNHMTSPDEPVLVTVWGDWAELYWQAPRPSPSRHIIPWNLVDIRPEFFAEWAADVLAAPPRVIVTDGDLLGPHVTDDAVLARAAGRSDHPLLTTPSYTALRQLVRNEYRVVNGSGDLLILEWVTPGTPRP